MDVKEATKSALEHLQAGNLQQAEQIFRDILKVQPDNVSALHFIGVIYYHLKNYDSAIKCIEKALQLGPDYVDAYNNLGIILQETGRLDEAITCYREGIRLNPNFDRAYYNLGTALKEKWQIDDAVSNYRKAIKLNPHLVEAYNNLGLALQDQGKLEEAEEYYRRALQMKPDFALCYSNLLFLMNHNSRHDAQAIFAEHLQFAKVIAEPLYPVTSEHANDRSPSRRLRIGYVSPDFRRHAVAYFIEPVISSHKREHFEVFCYSNSLKGDEVTSRIQAYADQWRTIAGMPDQECTELIRKDQIDILVDLAGHTANNRILVFTRKPAPIQISWIGYLATTGLRTMDYRIVDMYTDPPGMTDKFYTEELVRLPESFLCYSPDKDAPGVGKLPALTAGHITFGSFNKLAKVSQEVISAWSRILKAVPNSQLVMKTFGFRDGMTRHYMMDMFAQKGISAERIIMQASDLSPKHLESYNFVDMGLDTFPFNGATTTCEAMWMGVPVITLAGAAYHSRVGTSLLSNVGLTELIAKTHDEYIEIAVNLANDIERLQSLRESLRDMMTHSPLTDARKFIVDLENCYRTVWEKWCSRG